LFLAPDSGDYHLLPGSPCVDAGDMEAPALPEHDFEGDPRCCDGNCDGDAIADMGTDEFRQARAPESWFVPGWVWFSIPLRPLAGWTEGSKLLGFDCTNRLYSWDDVGKSVLLYPNDFTQLFVGPSYLARLAAGEGYTPAYPGSQPAKSFPWTLAAAGWCWVGVPGEEDLVGTGLSVRRGKVTRTAAEDRDAADPWLNWNWVYWNPVAREARIMNPFGGGDDTSLHPWYGYRVWSNTENVTIVFP